MSDESIQSLEKLSPEARRIVAHLQMQKIPHEGPWFSASYRSNVRLEGVATERYDTARVICSSIHTLMTAESFSALHRLCSDELWHYHAGAPVALLLLQPNGGARNVIIGPDILAGQCVQCAVPAGTWMGGRPIMGARHDWSLLGNVVAPGFEYDDYEAGIRDELIAEWPEKATEIRALTRE